MKTFVCNRSWAYLLNNRNREERRQNKCLCWLKTGRSSFNHAVCSRCRRRCAFACVWLSLLLVHCVTVSHSAAQDQPVPPRPALSGPAQRGALSVAQCSPRHAGNSQMTVFGPRWEFRSSSAVKMNNMKVPVKVMVSVFRMRQNCTGSDFDHRRAPHHTRWSYSWL